MSCVTRGYESRRVRVDGRTPIWGHPRGRRFGFFTQPSKFFHTLYFQSKRSLSNSISTNQDPTVLYEPSDPSCYIGVKGLSYRNFYLVKKKWSLWHYRYLLQVSPEAERIVTHNYICSFILVYLHPKICKRLYKPSTPYFTKAYKSQYSPHSEYLRLNGYTPNAPNSILFSVLA